MVTRGSGRPTCVSRDHGRAPASECSTGNTLRRGGVGGDIGVMAWVSWAWRPLDLPWWPERIDAIRCLIFLPIGPAETLAAFVSCPDRISLESFFRSDVWTPKEGLEHTLGICMEAAPFRRVSPQKDGRF